MHVLLHPGWEAYPAGKRAIAARPGTPAETPAAVPADDAPVLIRIETKSGHGASNTAKQIEGTADIYAFLMYNLGVSPQFGNIAKN